MNKNLSLIELIETVDRQSTKKQVFNQLLKDFSRAGLSLNLTVDSTTEQWVGELSKLTNELYLNDSNKLHQLLYLIDLPQEYYLKIEESGSGEIGMIFAQLILLRTLKKIAYRNQYS